LNKFVLSPGSLAQPATAAQEKAAASSSGLVISGLVSANFCRLREPSRFLLGTNP